MQTIQIHANQYGNWTVSYYTNGKLTDAECGVTTETAKAIAKQYNTKFADAVDLPF